jgi:flagellin
LLDNIERTAQNTEFNTMRLLDGSTAPGLHTSASQNASGPTVEIADMSALASAIANFNVTGAFDINDLDNAMHEVNMERANLGAMSNRFDHTANANSIMSLNLADARSRIADADIGREMSNFRAQETLTQVQMLMQQHRQDQEEQTHLAPVAPAR